MDTSNIRVFAINSSDKPEDAMSLLLRHTLRGLEFRGIRTEMMQLSGRHIHNCLDCLDCAATKSGKCKQIDDDGNAIIGKMIEADGILLGSPALPDGASAAMKSLLDRACMVSKANDGLLRHKVGAALVTIESTEALRTFDQLNHFFLVNEMIVAGSSYWQTGVGFDSGESARDPQGLSMMESLGRNMAWLLENLYGPIKLYESVEIVSQ